MLDVIQENSGGGTPYDESVHVHALWRTGSTCFWSCLRDTPTIRAYYEPFHENMLDRTQERCQESHTSKPKDEIFRHPSVAEHYFKEYPLSETGGIPGFSSRFILDDFIRERGQADPEMRDYVRSLIDFAGQQQQLPAFQYNRSILRAEWLQQEFGGLHLYLVRNPSAIFQSSMSFTLPDADRRGPGNYFLTCPVMVIGKNSEHPCFEDAARLLQINSYRGDSFAEEIGHYSSVAAGLDAQAHMDITALFWTLGVGHAVQYADLIVDVDHLAEQRYRRNVEEKFEARAAHRLSLGQFHELPDGKQQLPISTEMRSIIRDQLRELGADMKPFFDAVQCNASRAFMTDLLAGV